jgi:hypothetical protein
MGKSLWYGIGFFYETNSIFFSTNQQGGDKSDHILWLMQGT